LGKTPFDSPSFPIQNLQLSRNGTLCYIKSTVQDTGNMWISRLTPKLNGICLGWRQNCSWAGWREQPRIHELWTLSVHQCDSWANLRRLAPVPLRWWPGPERDDHHSSCELSSLLV